MNHLVAHLDASHFNTAVRQGGKLTVVDFWADWCRPCHALAPTLETLAGEYDGRVAFAKVNVDDESALASEFNVQSIPTLIVFRDGQEIDRLIGAQPKTSIERALGQALQQS